MTTLVLGCNGQLGEALAATIPVATEMVGLDLPDLDITDQKALQALCREVNPTVYRPEEFRSLSGNDNHFLGRVLREPRILIMGNDDELGRLAGKPLA